MELAEFQRQIERIYFERDRARGVGGTFLWFVEEVGELATALRRPGEHAELAEEFADVLAWLSTLASISGVELEEAVRKYADGCPGCHHTPCTCSEKH
ncbi:MAG: MazG nucleotide pyrophosphohydrolase domain-containing protein [Planctomycetota bacterium]